MFSGNLVILVLGGIDVEMQQLVERNGFLTISTNNHLNCAHNSLSGVFNKESVQIK